MKRLACFVAAIAMLAFGGCSTQPIDLDGMDDAQFTQVAGVHSARMRNDSSLAAILTPRRDH